MRARLMWRGPAIVLCVAGGLAFVAAGAEPSPSAASQSVTLTFVRSWDNACRCYKAQLSGQISSGASGEYVVVLHQYCGRSFSTAVAGATTREGGFWEAEKIPVSRPEALASESYRARWNGRLSAPVTFRGELSVTGEKLRGRRHRVLVYTYTTNPVNLKGRTVVLQREIGGRWTRFASERLAPHPVKYYTFVPMFNVPRRGWKLRALVPATSAAPCFVASASERWTS